MILTEQNQAQTKKIQKYKDSGYTELKQATWKKKKKEDPNGDFVNVDTYYYGYKPSTNLNTGNTGGSGNTGGNRGSNKPSCPSTPFKNSTESDAFRVWLLANYPEYKNKQKPFNVFPSPQPKYINTTALRCAYKDKGKEYEQSLNKKDTTKAKEDTSKVDYEKVAKNYEIGRELYIDELCSPWEDKNNFEIDFPGQENAMAKSFVDFIYLEGVYTQFKNDKTYRVGAPLQRALKKYAKCQKKFDDYVAEGITHKSPWLRDYVNYEVSWGQRGWTPIYDAWKSTLGLRNESIIRKKLIEYKDMKNITESLRKKLSYKTKKADVISENLYKVAGNFYNENYNQFFKKFEKLTENYKKSKLFLKEDSSENFNRAITKVFKGDEEKLRDEAIPFFMNKLGLEGAIKTQVETELKNKYNSDNVGSMFIECWADIVVQAFKDNAKSTITEPTSVMDAIEKIMVSKIDTPEFDYQLKKAICSMLKPAQEEKQTKVQDLAKKIAQSLIDSSES